MPRGPDRPSADGLKRDQRLPGRVTVAEVAAINAHAEGRATTPGALVRDVLDSHGLLTPPPPCPIVDPEDAGCGAGTGATVTLGMEAAGVEPASTDSSVSASKLNDRAVSVDAAGAEGATSAPHCDDPVELRHLLSEKGRDILRGILRVLVEREATFRTPTLLNPRDGFERILPIVRVQTYPFAPVLDALVACGFVVEVPEAELIKFCRASGDPPGPCLPLRQYWAEGTRGFLVTEHGRDLAGGAS